MNKPSENKATITNAIDKSKQPTAAPTKDELTIDQLDEVTAGMGGPIKPQPIVIVVPKPIHPF
jgi:hypothetical protein